MENIWEIYEFLGFVTDKFRNGDVNPEEATLALASGQQDVIDAIWRNGYSLSRTSLEDLSTITQESPQLVGPDDTIPYPEGYMYFLGLYDPTREDFRDVLTSELKAAMTSRMEPIAMFPRYRFTTSGIKMYGVATGEAVQLTWLSRPAAPKIAYTVDTDGNVVYDPVNSVQLSLPKHLWLKVIKAALPYLAVNLSDQELMALTAQTPAQQ